MTGITPTLAVMRWPCAMKFHFAVLLAFAQAISLSSGFTTRQTYGTTTKNGFMTGSSSQKRFHRAFVMQPPLRATTASPVQPSDEITAKSITNDILSFFQDRDRPTMEKDTVFANRLNSTEVSSKLDGLHMITLLYNCARARRRASVFIDIETIVNKIEVWDREWNERDISYFMYGINSLDCVNDIDGKLLKLALRLCIFV